MGDVRDKQAAVVKEADKKEISVLCTWGQGADVTVLLNGKPLFLLEEPTQRSLTTHGVVFNGDINLTYKDAIKLGAKLMDAGVHALDLEMSLFHADRERAIQGEDA